MTTLDMLLLLGVGGCALLGFLRGFVQEVLSLMAWAVAVLAVRLFLAPVSDLVATWLGAGGAASLLALALLFGLSFGAGRLLARRLGQSARNSLLGPVDRVLGAGFGGLKALIGASLVFLAFTLVYGLFTGGSEAARPQWLTGARSYPLLSASAQAISRFVAERNAPEGEGAAPNATEGDAAVTEPSSS